MQTYVDKNQERKNPLIGRTALQKKSDQGIKDNYRGKNDIQFTDDRPEVAQMKKQQELADKSAQNYQLAQLKKDMMNSNDHTNGSVLQRYKINEDGTKESTNNQILFEKKKDVYASDKMIEQANSIQGGLITLTKLPYLKENTKGEKLNAIWPKLKDTSNPKTKTDDYAYRDGYTGLIYQQKRLLEMQMENLFKKEAIQFICEEKKEEKETYDKEFYDTFEDFIEDEYEEDVKRKIAALAEEKKEKLNPQETYNQNARIAASMSPEYLFPSDCGAMANVVSGQTKENKIDTNTKAILPGDELHINPNISPSTTDQNLWGSHHGAVIMVDGADHLTLENAKQKEGDTVFKTEFDTGWYFGLYGTEKGQTFGDTYKDSFAPGFTVDKTSKGG